MWRLLCARMEWLWLSAAQRKEWTRERALIESLGYVKDWRKRR